ncbi:MAG TPA: hypothetical protein PLE19_18550 [Planctomycetota bacterium]|nr:hypothetical protein [Planctomycetota bacterium]HRR81020.1 hypothetical protein [Planctomycetota bacterium]HRT93620.1 hypothetical protein [Planctomycetota bacterium]
MADSHNLWTRAARSSLLPYALLAALCVFLWWSRAADLDLLYATYGLGPMSFVYKIAAPEQFARDFPSGAENVSKSAVMLVYPFAYLVLGIPPEGLWPAFLAFEIALMAFTMIVLVRTLRPRAPPIVAAVAALLAIASSARDMNFAAFRQPCLWATFYNVADALRILAIVLVLRGRPVLAGALLGGSFASHPTMGLMGGLFIAGCFAIEPRQLLRRGFLVGGFVFLAVAGLWTAHALGSEPAAGQAFPSGLWFDLTRLFSHHWYPIEEGLLASKHRAAFVPFLSFLALLGYCLGREAPLGERDRGAAAGMATMLALTALGLVFSTLRLSPTLTKLALHRANDLLLTVGLVYVVAGLWSELDSDRLWRGLAAAAALASPFLSKPGFPLLASLLLAAPFCLRRGPLSARLMAGVPAVAGVLAVAFYALLGMAGPIASAAYTGFGWLGTPPVLIGGGVLVLALLARRALAQAALVASLAAAALHWQAGFRLKPELRAWSQAYKDAQLWARDHTPPDALFLVDPVIFDPDTGYGWRDYSRRSSFGSLREWLYLSWHYTSDYRLCQEGLKRVAEFGVNVSDHLRQPPANAASALAAEVQRRYYTATDDWRLDLARRYHVDYFVSRRFGGSAASRLPLVYGNPHFVIQAAVEPAK